MSAQTDIKTSAGSSISTADSQSTKGDSAVLRVLKELGTILTTGTIIGASGKVIGATDTQVAIWTLSVTAIVFIFIYRTAIQRKLKSDRILIVILAVSIVCTFFVGTVSTFFLITPLAKLLVL